MRYDLLGKRVVCTYRFPGTLQPWIHPFYFGTVIAPGDDVAAWNGSNSERVYCENTHSTPVQYEDGIMQGGIAHEKDDCLLVVTPEQESLPWREQIRLFLGEDALAHFDRAMEGNYA